MKKINIFCFGFGQVAMSFINKLILEKIQLNLTITSREKTQKKKFKGLSYQSYQFNERQFDQELLNELSKADYILLSIAPVNGEDLVLKHIKNKIKENKFKWITYLSATSVYGNHNGKWVDEKSETNPTSTNGKERLEVERNWLKFSEENNLPFQIFRLSGIYSNKYNVLERLKKGEVKIVKKENHFFSRIHLEDIANVLYISLKNFKTGEVYNISDDKPAPLEDVVMYGVKLLGFNTPKTINENEIESEMLKNFYKDSKKVSNKKMKNYFQISLKHPTYVEGLNYINDNSI
jgi:hypothetical protein